MAEQGLNTNGAYPVFDTSGNIALYGKLLATKQAKEQAEQKEISDKLGKLNTKGLREYDKEDYYKGYDQWRTLEQQASKEKDQRKKFELKSQADKAYQGLNELVGRSSEKAKRDAQLGMQILQKPYLFNEEGKKMYQRSITAPLSSADNIEDYTQIPLGHDFSKIPDSLSKAVDETMKSAVYQNDLGRRVTSGNRTGTIKKKVLQGKPEVLAEKLGLRYLTDDSMKSYVQQQYPDLDWDGNESQAKSQAIQDLVNKMKPTLIKDEGFHEVWDTKESSGDGDGNGRYTVGEPSDLVLPYMGGKARVETKDYVGLSVPGKNFAGTPAYSLTEGGKPTSMASSDKYSVVGVSRVPFIKGFKGKDGQLSKSNGTIAQPNFAKNNQGNIEYRDMLHVVSGDGEDKIEYMTPVERMPANVASDKKVKAALDSFYGARKQSQPTQAKQTTKSTPSSPKRISSDAEYNALPKGARYIDPNGQVRVKNK